MAEADPSGIPSGLNRIRTGRVPQEDQSSSGGDDSPALSDHRAGAQEPVPSGIPQPVLRGDNISDGDRRVSDETGFLKGKKIARWFTSSFTTKDSNKAFDNVPSNHEKDLCGKHALPASKSVGPKTKKSFSHELGPRGGIRPSLHRARSYSDLKELLGSLNSKFDAAKEAVNAELAAFEGDVIDALEKDSLLEERGTADGLLILSQQCKVMTSSVFRENCEMIVQDLAERRHQCQSGILKRLLTRMLFILTRCTRLLQFEKDNVTINEDSFDRIKQCLESVPTVEMNWIPKPGNEERTGNADFGLDSIMKQEYSTKCSMEEQDKIATHSTESCITESGVHSLSSHGSTEIPPSYNQDSVSQYNQISGSPPANLLRESSWDSLHEQEESSDGVEEEESSGGVDLVLCRICEQNVPTSRLESHSYICAYADKCDLEGSDVDERLLKIAEILEQIVESYRSFHASYSSPEISKIQSANLAMGSEGHSPKVQEWHSKGTEGMFEDLHEMDTAGIDDSHLATSNNLRSHLVRKLGPGLATSSNGSLTPVSCTTTPRSSHFDLYWLEHNNPSEPEDVNQMNELANIAHRVAAIDLAHEGASKSLDLFKNDLLDILQHSQLKALVIDTFGSRLQDLLREKHLLANELKGSCKNMIQFEEAKGHSIVNASQCTISAPSHLSHKERTSIADFEIIKPISRGAFGEVSLARKRTTGDLFAIKALKKLDMLRKNDIERILAERNILIAVRNPFVARCLWEMSELPSLRDNLYLVMEYLNGGDLYSLLRKVGCLEEDVARVYIAELVLALEYLHSLGIIHRDLKPDNILISRDGHIKLTDFGLSKIGLINSAIDLSGSGIDDSILLNAQNLHVFPGYAHQRGKRGRQSAVGTPDYLAPEILLGNAHGYAADWWSVGIIFFEFLTGIPPFTAKLPEMIFDNILSSKIPWPSVPNDMSYEAKDLIDRLLIQDPDLRLGTNGASEVKTHPFFKEINWDSLALQKAAFIPNPDSADDTSYFMSRYPPSSSHIAVNESSSACTSDTTNSSSNRSLETNTDKYSELKEFDSRTSLDLSSINFSFKNLSQLASMNYDVLLQSGKTSKCSSPSKGPYS